MLTPSAVVRLALEQNLGEEMASAVLSEALAGSSSPDDKSDFLDVVRGPLKLAIERRCGPLEAMGIVGQLEESLTSEPDTVERPLEDLAAEGRKEDETAVVPIMGHRVRVFVLAAGDGLATKLRQSLGDANIEAIPLATIDALRTALSIAQPAAIVVDAADFPPIDQVDLAFVEQGLPSTTACAVIGPELPFGKSLLSALGSNGLRWMRLSMGDGLEPLHDVLRARQQ